MRVRPTDEQLLASADPEGFAAFYVRHLPGIEAYFARRVDRQTAADLAAETFASAFVARRRFVAGATPAAGWLYTIAARRLIDFRRRASVDRRTLEALAFEADRAHTPAATAASEAPEELDAGLLRHLPPDQRAAIVAHVLEERDYSQIAAVSRASEAVIRQRVSRGLGALRGPLRVYRAAQELAREGHSYRFGGGHRVQLQAIAPGEPLDCSAATSLILARAGAFEPGAAWPSGRLAQSWGIPGEGRYVTVWANEGHVWLEFKLDADHGERFDPTPSRLRPNRDWLAKSPAPIDQFVPRHWPGL